MATPGTPLHHRPAVLLCLVPLLALLLAGGLLTYGVRAPERPVPGAPYANCGNPLQVLLGHGPAHESPSSPSFTGACTAAAESVATVAGVIVGAATVAALLIVLYLVRLVRAYDRAKAETQHRPPDTGTGA